MGGKLVPVKFPSTQELFLVEDTLLIHRLLGECDCHYSNENQGYGKENENNVEQNIHVTKYYNLLPFRSVTLLVQAVLPCTLFADSVSTYKLRGGTNAEFAPQIDYTIHVSC